MRKVTRIANMAYYDVLVNIVNNEDELDELDKAVILRAVSVKLNTLVNIHIQGGKIDFKAILDDINEGLKEGVEDDN